MIAPVTYVIYLLISIVLTLMVARSLNKHGLAFLAAALNGRLALAQSTHRLLLLGFHLVGFGVVIVLVFPGTTPVDWPSALTFLATRFGLVLLTLGVIHLITIKLIAALAARLPSEEPAKRAPRARAFPGTQYLADTV